MLHDRYATTKTLSFLRSSMLFQALAPEYPDPNHPIARIQLRSFPLGRKENEFCWQSFHLSLSGRESARIFIGKMIFSHSEIGARETESDRGDGNSLTKR